HCPWTSLGLSQPSRADHHVLAAGPCFRRSAARRASDENTWRGLQALSSSDVEIFSDAAPFTASTDLTNVGSSSGEIFHDGERSETRSRSRDCPPRLVGNREEKRQFPQCCIVGKIVSRVGDQAKKKPFRERLRHALCPP